MAHRFLCLGKFGCRWLIVLLHATLPLAQAASGIPPGSYRCWSYNVSGGAGNCRLAPPIVIRPDGTYKESSATGTYRVEGDRISFSRSTIRGAGLVAGGNKITFEYDYNGRHHTVTYLCQDCSPPGEP